MLDLHKTLVIVSSWPDYNIDHRLVSYLDNKGLPLYNLLVAERKHSVIERRNKIIKHLVLPVTKRYEWFMFIDHDHYPEGNLWEPFFDDVPEDVVGCEYLTGNRHSWATPDQFHMGCVRVRREAILRLQPPWFQFTYNSDATKITLCECGYFRRQLLDTGSTITRRGSIGHETQRTWYH